MPRPTTPRAWLQAFRRRQRLQRVNAILDALRHDLEWVAFEPNTERTWSKARTQVSDRLGELWHSGILPGVTREQSFRVRCDRTTMTVADIEAGHLIIEIDITIDTPANFTTTRIQQQTAKSP
jgi:uncharacterized protein